MDRNEWLNERDSRTLRYSNRRLDHRRRVHLSGDSEYLGTYEGQVAALVACNLLARMTPNVAFDFPKVPVVAPLPWVGSPLPDLVLQQMLGADPLGDFDVHPALPDDTRLFIGRSGGPSVIHGSGWSSYAGPSPSPLTEADGTNPFGAGLAAIIAVARLFEHDLAPPPLAIQFDTFRWRDGCADPKAPPPALANLGKLWFAGVGSVGSAALYFLSLATRDFAPALIDMDVVKIHNLDRSPIFNAADADPDAAVPTLKVRAAERFLRSVGIENVRVDDKPLHEAPTWLERKRGEPDVLIAAANELNARPIIEEAFPPLQIYATTGRASQVMLVRHIPMVDPCSRCLFPASEAANVRPMGCANGERTVVDAQGQETRMDAALPFLSFAAGLMTAAEITKLQHPGYPHSANRAFLQFLPEPNLVEAMMTARDACPCRHRSENVHQKMIEASKYAHLTTGIAKDAK